ncbi:SPO1 DNA polymerase [Sulfurifustis variabilis]|uniref:Type-5 uracil-DNA glycosylase n=1 Tax=Sulfurifustis variabilis TaxID=1675686 RepID=A0A1B4V4E9_9GAMM|nr:uracil-DNA glycosylase [Sulfurifustis variabilis]BAU48265.1 SPO1 DNA polymerase [Sulfurifustis variabilis]
MTRHSVFDPGCRACPRLARHLAAVRREHPEYHAAPVPPFGDRNARLVVVGLAPGMHGANRTGRPFTGDHAGILLYETLHRFGFASRPEALHARDGLRLRNCRITNAVKCLPPGNKPLPDEVTRCNGYLKAELLALRPGSVLLALGLVAHAAVLKAYALRVKDYRFAHGAEHRLPGGIALLDSYHCSRYNTQTGRLTAAMFRRVVRRAGALVARP